MKTNLLQIPRCFKAIGLVLMLGLLSGHEMNAQNVTRLITDFNGFWNSTNGNTTPRPNNRHNVLAFGHGGVVYSTGADDATLLANSVVFTPGQFRALPISELPGNTGSGSNNYLAMGKAIDGNPLVTNYLAPGIIGVTAKSTLIDGIKGLDIGTGVTNVREGLVLTIPLSNIMPSAVTDNVPDFLLTQIADPTGFDTFEFVNAAGVRVGTVYNANFTNQASLGKYDIDLFTLSSNTPYATATPVANGTAGNSWRDIFMLAVKFADFGINETNYDQIAGIRWTAKGNSDPGFFAYNEESFLLGAPVITVHPEAAITCLGDNVSFSVTAVGENLTYQWYRNGVLISGATNPVYEISSVEAANAGAYTVTVTNEWGTVLSEQANLNSLFLMHPASASICIGVSATLSVNAVGNNPSYQWYSNTTNSNVGGTLLPGATSATLNVSFDTSGPRYYFAEAIPDGNACASVRSNVATVNVANLPVGGTVTTPFTTACLNTSATMSLSGHTGSIQWEGSNTSATTGFSNLASATSTSYTTGALPNTRYYRARLTSGGCVAYSNVITITVTSDNHWRGTIDSNWNTAGNWACGSVPDASSNVVINQTASENYPVADVAIVANNITIGSGGSLTLNANATFENIFNSGNVAVNSGAVLTVATQLSNNAPASAFTIANNASLMQLSTTANETAITVNKNSSLLYRQDYTLWSSPVMGQNLQDFSPVTLPTRFYAYTPSSDAYTLVDPSATNFATGQSYLIRMPNQNATPGYNTGAAPITFEGTFSGIPHNGTVNLALSTAGNGYNAVGNPYPSAINVVEFFAANESNIVDGSALYFWRKKNDGTVSSYATLTTLAYTANNVEGGDTGTGFFNAGDEDNWQINPGQGFIVQVDNPALVFNNDMRRGNANGQFFRTSQDIDVSRYWLNISGSQSFSQMAVGYTPMGTLGLDYALDGKAVTAGNLALYSVEATEKLAIQARPEFDVNDAVALGFKADAAGTYEISLSHFDGLFANQNIYLEDLVLGTSQNLTENAYTFTTEAGEFENRFRVVYQVTLDVNHPAHAASQVVLVSQNGRIDVSSGSLQMNEIKVFDVRGRMLHRAAVNATHYTLSGMASDQVLILQIETASGTVNKKTIIKAQ